MTNASFVYQYLFDEDHSVSAVKKANINELAASNQTLWQHLDLNQDGVRNWLEHDAGLDSIVFEALVALETRPRSLATKNGLLVVLRGVNTNPAQDPQDMVSIRVWIEKNRVLSAHNRPLMSIKDITTSFEEGSGPRTSGEFLTMLVENLANRIGDFVNTIEDDMGVTEDSLETAKPSELRASLGSLRRQIALVRRFLAPQRDALDRLNHIETNILSNRDQQRLREESDRVSRYIEDLDLARERAVVLQETFLSQLAQEQNTRIYVLSVISAIFLPLMFVTGLLGMNVGGLPGSENPVGFLIATAIMISASICLILLFKWRKWI